MSNRRNTALLIFFSLTVLIFSGGCTRPPIKALTDYDIKAQAGATKVPLRAGLYLSPAFRNYTWRAPDPLFPQIQLGDSMTSGAEKALKYAFKEAVLINETEQTSNEYDVIVGPEIVEAGFSGRAGEWASADCRIVSKWSFLKPDGKIVYLNTFTGKVTHKGSVSTFISGCMTLAIQDHYNKVLTGIMSANWWEGMERGEK